jgi:hypothetical protein
MDQLPEILKRLTEYQVDFVLVGGMAAIAHGSSITTKDVDVCAPLGEPNLSKILNALREIHPKQRMRPDRMPLPDDPDRLRQEDPKTSGQWRNSSDQKAIKRKTRVALSGGMGSCSRSPTAASPSFALAS